MVPAAAGKEKRYAYTTVVERIRDRIRAGTLAPGDQLPPERQLARELAVSRTSVRQALQALAERGVVVSRQGDGTYVADGLAASFPGDAILDALNRERGVLGDILEFRRLLEPQIAALAAQRIKAENIDRLKVVVCDQQRALLAGREDAELDAEFHRLLAEYAGNRVLVRVMAALRATVDETRAARLRTSGRRSASVEGHLRLIDALEAGDAAAAHGAMERHLAEIGTCLLGKEDQHQAPDHAIGSASGGKNYVD
ncbi:MAG: FadR/GntR family transcriptional regulator [Desulfobulbus sp.]|jgi:GntR family transcriptional repressor for pyruvate dehydrogenase complex|nr:FadR/GntR family transcriptional regulator [Desulfobulbus sp.]